MALPQKFRDRTQAGAQLATQLQDYANSDVVVLGLPRGGVPVAFEVAMALKAPLDLCVVRKLGVPGHEELAMGAIAANVRYLNRAVLRQYGLATAEINQVIQKEEQELARRELAYRSNRPPVGLVGQVAIVVDDGLATGATMRAAIAAIQRQSPKAIVVAVPVAAPQICQRLKRKVDAVVSVRTPECLGAIGLWYEDFSQTTDEEVQGLLHHMTQVRQARADGLTEDVLLGEAEMDP
ncbi:MAG: phosphoribosyltransferase [Elainellaceae cyanobacterium]